tara:strand:+ start:224 stop:688 length:465 start_codon:yes stop_codon:yes gene_type:complete
MQNSEDDSQYNESIGEWVLDNTRGWYFNSYNTNDEDEDEEDELVLESNEEPVLYHVWTSRSQPRNLKTGEIAFDITINIGTDKEKTSRIPITKLMDLNDNTIEYEEVVNAINDWIAVANKYPNIIRKCICCSKKAKKSNVLCYGCKKYNDIIYA